MKREWKNLTAEEYHAAPGLSSSALRCYIREGRLKYYARYIQKKLPVVDSHAMKMGRVFHKAMEAPNGWQDSYLVMPDVIPDDATVHVINNAAKAAGSKAESLIPGKEWEFGKKLHRQFRDHLQAQSAREQKELLTPAELEIVKCQINAVFDNTKCREWITETQIRSEISCFLETEKLPWPLKALIDIDHAPSIIDFKKTCEHHYSGFIRDAFRRGYHWQLAYYALVAGRTEGRIIAVTDSAPFEANLYVLDERRMKGLIAEIREHVKRLAADCEVGEFEDTATDSFGVPPKWHNENWDAEIPLDLKVAAGVEFDE